jgi:hypothetical protein
MARIPKWLLEKLEDPNDPRQNADGSPVCQSWNVSGYWKGHPCGNDAKFRVGEEDACYAHVTQALERQPGAEVKPR